MNIFAGQTILGWVVKSCVGGLKPNTPEAWQYLVDLVRFLGLSTIPWKVANGTVRYNLREVNGGYVDDILPGLYAAFEDAGIPKIGWHYLYGDNPLREAEIAAARIDQLGLDGYILDPEKEYKQAGKGTCARQFLRRLRELLPITPLALCSYRFPSLHAQFPWSDFLAELDSARGDVWMPQVYPEGNTQPNGIAMQLSQSAAELTALEKLPIVPVGPAYGVRVKLTYWMPTPEQMDRFSAQAITLGCPGISWWCLDDIMEKDCPYPTQTGKQGWWKVIHKLGQVWTNPLVSPQPDTPPVTNNPPLSLELLSQEYMKLDQRMTRLEKKLGVIP